MKKIILLFLSIVLCIFCCFRKEESKIIYQGLYGRNVTLLDPGKVQNKYTRQIIPQIYETLLEYDFEHKSYLPKLAESYTVNNENNQYIFKLKDDISFHDGSKLNSEDIIYTFRRVYDKSFILHLKENVDSFHFDLLSAIDSIEEIDSLTVIFRLKYPASNFLKVLASPDYASILSSENIKRYWGNIDKNPSGTGPFYLKDWTNEKEIILEKYEDYWGEKPKIDEIHFILKDDGDELEKLILKDSLDVLNYITGTKIDLFLSKEKLNLLSKPPKTTTLLGFNLQVKPYDNIKIRRAVLHALDISRFTSFIERTNAILPLGPLPPSLFDYTDNRFIPKYDLAAARTLLSEVELLEEINTKILIYGESVNKTAVGPRFISSFLGKIGINLEIRVCFDLNEFDTLLHTNEFGLFILKWENAIPDDPGSFLKSLFYSRSSKNYFNFSHKEFDSLMDKALLTFDDIERNKLYLKAINIISDDVPAIFLNHVKEIIVTNKNISTIETSPLGFINYTLVEL